MPRARTPVAKAKAAGADVKNPQRHRDRGQAKGVAELGKPSAGLGEYAKRAFELFRRELPWLKESHRVIVELAATYRGRMLDPEDHISLQAAQELRRCLAQLGATPADESRVMLPDDGDQDEDEAFFSARPPH